LDAFKVPFILFYKNQYSIPVPNCVLIPMRKFIAQAFLSGIEMKYYFYTYISKKISIYENLNAQQNTDFRPAFSMFTASRRPANDDARRASN